MAQYKTKDAGVLVFLNRLAAARYRTLASTIPGRENLSF
jgi:hypothetical protein